MSLHTLQRDFELQRRYLVTKNQHTLHQSLLSLAEPQSEAPSQTTTSQDTAQVTAHSWSGSACSGEGEGSGVEGRPSTAEGSDAEGQASTALHEELTALTAERQRLREMHRELLKKHHDGFHPIWGQMLKTGYQNSMYASLMERFACLYTSHVRNLCLYSPHIKFRGRVDVMAHEQVSLGGEPSQSFEDALWHYEVPDLEVLQQRAADESGA